MKDKLFQLFFSFYLFWYAIVTSIFFLGKIEMEGVYFKGVIVSIFALSIVFYILYKRSPIENYVIFGLILFGTSYYFTHLFYYNYPPNAYKLYIGQFLRWGTDSISACLLGMTIVKQVNYKIIHKTIPIVCILVTILLSSMVLLNAGRMAQYSLSSGMNYQILAYSLALQFGYCSYYVFMTDSISSKMIKNILLLLLPLQLVMCMMSGGRGGVVLLIIYILFLLWTMCKSGKYSYLKVIIIIFFSFLFISLFAVLFDLENSTGFSRSSHLMHDSDRINMWVGGFPLLQKYLFNGGGLGSEFFILKGYSHNILIDFILETGILGTIILCVIFFKIYRAVFRNVFTNDIFIIISIVGIYGLVMNSFSGYWISTYAHWMILGVACTYKYHLEYEEEETSNLDRR